MSERDGRFRKPKDWILTFSKSVKGKKINLQFADDLQRRQLKCNYLLLSHSTSLSQFEVISEDELADLAASVLS